MSNCFKPVIQVSNTASTNVLANGTIPLPTAVHGNSSVLTSNGIGVTISRCGGYYDILAMVTFTAPVAGDVTINILQDGVIVGTATTTITTATTETRTLTIPALVIARCSNLPDNITLTSSLAITTSNATLIVEKRD